MSLCAENETSFATESLTSTPALTAPFGSVEGIRPAPLHSVDPNFLSDRLKSYIDEALALRRSAITSDERLVAAERALAAVSNSFSAAKTTNSVLVRELARCRAALDNEAKLGQRTHAWTSRAVALWSRRDIDATHLILRKAWACWRCHQGAMPRRSLLALMRLECLVASIALDRKRTVGLVSSFSKKAPAMRRAAAVVGPSFFAWETTSRTAQALRTDRVVSFLKLKATALTRRALAALRSFGVRKARAHASDAAALAFARRLRLLRSFSHCIFVWSAFASSARYRRLCKRSCGAVAQLRRKLFARTLVGRWRGRCRGRDSSDHVISQLARKSVLQGWRLFARCAVAAEVESDSLAACVEKMMAAKRHKKVQTKVFGAWRTLGPTIGNAKAFATADKALSALALVKTARKVWRRWQLQISVARHDAAVVQWAERGRWERLLAQTTRAVRWWRTEAISKRWKVQLRRRAQVRALKQWTARVLASKSQQRSANRKAVLSKLMSCFFKWRFFTRTRNELSALVHPIFAKFVSAALIAAQPPPPQSLTPQAPPALNFCRAGRLYASAIQLVHKRSQRASHVMAARLAFTKWHLVRHRSHSAESLVARRSAKLAASAFSTLLEFSQVQRAQRRVLSLFVRTPRKWKLRQRFFHWLGLARHHWRLKRSLSVRTYLSLQRVKKEHFVAWRRQKDIQFWRDVETLKSLRRRDLSKRRQHFKSWAAFVESRRGNSDRRPWRP